MITCKIPPKGPENLKEIHFLVFGILFVHDQTKTVAANSQYVSLSFSSPSPSALPHSLSSLSLRQKINQEYPKTYAKNLLNSPLQFLFFTQNTPKINKPDRREKKMHQIK
jgi:hypothetical protein